MSEQNPAQYPGQGPKPPAKDPPGGSKTGPGNPFDLFRRYVRPRDYIRALADAFFDRHLRGHYVIGVHVRGTDWMAWDDIPFAALFASIEARLAVVVGGRTCRIFLATDEAGVVDQFAQRFGDRLICYDTVRRAKSQARAATGPAKGPVPGYVAKSSTSPAKTARTSWSNVCSWARAISSSTTAPLWGGPPLGSDQRPSRSRICDLADAPPGRR